MRIILYMLYKKLGLIIKQIFIPVLIYICINYIILAVCIVSF